MFKLLHRCQESYDIKKEELKIDMKSQWVSSHGPAIPYIEYLFNDSKWVAHCDEYASMIEYCPFCGMRLPTEVTIR